MVVFVYGACQSQIKSNKQLQATTKRLCYSKYYLFFTQTCTSCHTIWRWNSQPTLKFGMQVGDIMLASNILLSGNNYAKIAVLFKFMNMGWLQQRRSASRAPTVCLALRSSGQRKEGKSSNVSKTGMMWCR